MKRNVIGMMIVLVCWGPFVTQGGAQGVRVEDFLPEQVRLPQPIPYPTLNDLPDAIQRADTKRIAEVLSRVEAYVEGMGNPRVPELAQAIWEAGYQAFSMGDRELAEQLWETALRLNPDESRYYLSLARVSFQQGIKGWVRSFGLLKRAIGRLWYHRFGQGLFFNFFLLVLSAILTRLLAGFGIISLIKYIKPFQHDLWEKIGARTEQVPITWALAFFLLGLPLVFIGFVWGAIWWLILLFLYASRRTRMIFASFLISILVFILLAHFSMAVFERNQKTTPRWLFDFVHADKPAQTMHELYYILHRDPMNVKATLAYASFFVRNQQYDKAMNIYTRAIRAGVDDPAVWMNLGNLFYLQELPRQALLFYERAEQRDILDPKFKALLFYNKGKAYHSILEFSKGEELIQEAFRLNPALSRYITDTTLVMDAYPTAKDLHYPDWSFVIRQGLADTFSDPRFILLILFILIGVVLYIIRWPTYNAKQCERCGDAYCPRCTSKIASFPYCNACMHLFILRDGISPAARKQKLHQIEIFNRKTALIRNLVRLLIPGSGPFYINERFNGIWIMLIIATGLSIISEISHVAPWWVPSHDLPGPVLLAVLTILVVYLFNGIYILIRKA